MDFKPNYHECDDPDVEWRGNYFVGGIGETLERLGYCKNCKQEVKEVWVYSCELVNS